MGAGLVTTVLVLMQSTIAAELARAGTYVMRNCNVPGHPAAPMQPWSAVEDPAGEVSIVDACATGGGVGFAVGDARRVRGNASAQIVIHQPPAPRSQITFVKAVLWYAARLAGSGAPLNFVPYYSLPDWTRFYGTPVSPPGSENLVAEQAVSPDAASYYAGIYCGPLVGGPSEPCVAADRMPLLVRGMEVTLREDVPPTLAQPRGTLLEAGPQRGVRTVVYSASDPHSGISKVDVLLSDTVVASHDLTSRCPYSDFTVCPAALDETLEVDTRAVSNGSHRLTVAAQDAAGNERTAYGGHLIAVHNDAGAMDGSAFGIDATFKGTSRSTLTAPYGARVFIRGRLTEASRPAAGSLIEVLERRDRRGAREVSRGRVKTNADGSFSVRLVTTRPSRTIRLAFRPAAASPVLSRALKLRVRAGSRVRASLRGSLLRFSGGVLGAPIPKGGKTVVMEGRSPGSAWTPFKNLRTDRRGRFSGTYRLRVRRPGVKLRVRAFVPSEAGYGYLGSRSRALTLRVR